jgi:hypothetical protein
VEPNNSDSLRRFGALGSGTWFIDLDIEPQLNGQVTCTYPSKGIVVKMQVRFTQKWGPSGRLHPAPGDRCQHKRFRLVAAQHTKAC